MANVLHYNKVPNLKHRAGGRLIGISRQPFFDMVEDRTQKLRVMNVTLYYWSKTYSTAKQMFKCGVTGLPSSRNLQQILRKWLTILRVRKVTPDSLSRAETVTDAQDDKMGCVCVPFP